MELTQLYQFLEVARQGNITHAAQRLYISQPALSKSIKLLEQELGVQLFDRRKNRILLNENGALALRHISAALDELESMQKALLAAAQKPQLMRFCAQSASSLRFFVSQFNAAHPEIETRSDVVPVDEIRPLLLDRQYDIAFSFAPSTMPDIHSIPLGLEQILISAPLHHPLAGRRCLTLQDLDEQDFYLFA